jgi:hypothetical protein
MRIWLSFFTDKRQEHIQFRAGQFRLGNRKAFTYTVDRNFEIVKNMKGQIVLFSFCVMALQNAYSQNQNDKTVVSFSLGASLPVGNFSSTDPANKFSGYAKVGETINFSLVHKFYENVGLIAMLYGQRNGLNTNLLAQQFAQTAIYFGNTGNGPNYYPNWSIDKMTWYSESFLLGITDEFFIKSSTKISFTAKALIGVANVQLPRLNASSTTDTSFVTITQSGASAIGFSYLAGVGLKYKCSKNIYLMLGTDYFGTSQIDFKNVTQTITATNGGLVVPKIYSLSNSRLPPQAISYTGTNSQPVGSININLAVGIKL